MIKSRRMRWAGHVARMWDNRNANRILVGRPEGKRPLGRRICRWVDNNKTDHRETGWGGMGWTDLAQVGTSGGLLWTSQWTFRVHKILGNSCVTAQRATSQEVLSSMELTFLICILLCVIWKTYNGTVYTTIILKETEPLQHNNSSTTGNCVYIYIYIHTSR
jgi:hypothetical protein